MRFFVIAIGLTFFASMLLPALYGKRSPEGEFGFDLLIGTIIAAVVGAFFLLPFGARWRDDHQTRLSRGATASLGWRWAWRSSAQTGLIGGRLMSLDGRVVQTELPVPTRYTQREPIDLAAIALLGPSSRAVLRALEARAEVVDVALEGVSLKVTATDSIDAELLADLVRATAVAGNTLAADWGQVAPGIIPLARRAADRVRHDPEPAWRLDALEALLGTPEARAVTAELVQEIDENDPHPKLALRAAVARGDDGAVGRIRGRWARGGGELSVADGADGGLAVSEHDE